MTDNETKMMLGRIEALNEDQIEEEVEEDRTEATEEMIMSNENIEEAEDKEEATEVEIEETEEEEEADIKIISRMIGELNQRMTIIKIKTILTGVQI